MKPQWRKGYFIGHVLLCLFIGLSVTVLPSTPTHASSTGGTSSFVRIIHASPDIGTADVFLDGSKLLGNFQFGTVTNYAAIPPGPHKVEVSLIGKGPNAATITQTLAVSPGVAYTVAALGTQAAGFSLQVFQDNNQLSPGAAKLRFYHLSPGTGSLTVATNNSALIQGLTYKQASNYINTSAGSYTYQAVSTQPSVSLPVSVTLKADTVTSEFAVGVVNGTPAIQFVSSQVTGIPGLPNTGSDPHPVVASRPDTALPVPLWSIFVLLICIGAGIALRQAALHRKM